MGLVAKISQFFNPVNTLIITSMLQGVWLTAIVIDALKHWWLPGLIHMGCLALNGYSLFVYRTTMFMSIWNAALYHQQLQAQKVLDNRAQHDAQKPIDPT